MERMFKMGFRGGMFLVEDNKIPRQGQGSPYHASHYD
jgi:hypothetical protein